MICDLIYIYIHWAHFPKEIHFINLETWSNQLSAPKMIKRVKRVKLSLRPPPHWAVGDSQASEQSADPMVYKAIWLLNIICQRWQKYLPPQKKNNLNVMEHGYIYI